VQAEDEAAALAHIADSDGIYGEITPEMLAAARQLRWVQAPVAGVERYLFPELVESSVIVTNVAGIYSDQIADHAIMFLLMFARGMHIYFRRQLAGKWQSGVPVIHVADQTLGVIGLGGIGNEVARRGRALGMRVLAVDAKPRAKPDHVAALWGIERLDDLLAASDFVVSCVPHTPETEKLLTRPQFQRMKRTAYLINISRGIVVDLADVTEALQEGTIAGAAMDVFEVEPLPADHPLWEMENVLITPHMASNLDSPHIPMRRISLVADNLRRFVAGEPLQNVIDKSRWF
jgi:phosphoglycerate dehydrogenase-like enzyme